ncbi:MAG: LysM peptidoglycan-binding domain-containing protein, partial [Alphaproteobacteria bacterium]
MFRIDEDGKFRYNRTGDPAAPASAQQQKTFTASINQALRERKQAGGSGTVDPNKEKVAVVEPGDAPERIARDSGITLDELQSANKGIFDANDLLQPNEVIFIPQRDPVLTAESPKDAKGVPSDEADFKSDLRVRGSELQDGTLTPQQVDAGRLDIQKDAKAYLDALPASERQAAAQRLLGGDQDWPAGNPARTAVLNAGADSFADTVHQRGDDKGEIAKISADVKTFLEALPQADRTAALQYIYDDDWQDAGSGKTAIEQAAKDMGIPLRESGHTGSEPEAAARAIVDTAGKAGSPADMKKSFNELSQAAPADVQLALKRNPEAVQLLRDAENREKVDKWLDGRELEYTDGVNTVIGALKGEDGTLGKLDESSRKYLLDKVLGKLDTDERNSDIGLLAETVSNSDDPALRSLVGERMASRAADITQSKPAGQLSPEDRFRARLFADQAVRAASPAAPGQDGKFDMTSLRTMLETLGPEKAAALVQSLGFKMEYDTSMDGSRRSTALQGLLMAANSGEHTPTTSAVVQNVFALSDTYSPTLRPSIEDGPGEMAKALAREWFPDDAKARDAEASRLQSILDTRQGRELLFPGTGDDSTLSLG